MQRESPQDSPICQSPIAPQFASAQDVKNRAENPCTRNCKGALGYSKLIAIHMSINEHCQCACKTSRGLCRQSPEVPRARARKMANDKRKGQQARRAARARAHTEKNSVHAARRSECPRRARPTAISILPSFLGALCVLCLLL